MNFHLPTTQSTVVVPATTIVPAATVAPAPSQNSLTEWQDALVKFGLDYTVEKRPLYAAIGDGHSPKLVDNLYSIVRSDTNEPLPGVAVNGRYHCIQTSEYAPIGNEICQELGAEFVRGGSLAGGRSLFLQAKLPEPIRVKGSEDLIDKLLTFVTSHDGSTCFMVVPTALRLFCKNQFNALMHDVRQSGIKIRHTSTADIKLKEVAMKVQKILGIYEQFEKRLNHYVDCRMSEAQMKLATTRLFGVKDGAENVPTRTANNIENVLRLTEEGKGQDHFQGTAYNWINAVYEYSDHERALRKGTNRFESSLVGSGSRFKAQAAGIVDDILANNTAAPVVSYAS